MEVVTIKKVDLKKLIKRSKKVRSLYQLAKLSGVDYSYLNRAMNEHIKFSENAWNRIKKYL